jgi:hypothetical protein
MKAFETYKIGENFVKLYQIKFIANKLGWTAMAVRQKEKRGVVPPANFRSPSGNRLYAAEEIALFEYIFKEVWPRRQGTKSPDWLKALTKDLFALVREQIIAVGYIENEDTFGTIQEKYGSYGFSKYKAWIYILNWREIFDDKKHTILKDLIDLEEGE